VNLISNEKLVMHKSYILPRIAYPFKKLFLLSVLNFLLSFFFYLFLLFVRSFFLSFFLYCFMRESQHKISSLCRLDDGHGFHLIKAPSHKNSVEASDKKHKT
jgi:hypothetical protein